MPLLAQIFKKGNPLAAFPPDLQPLPTELVIIKQNASAFHGTFLSSILPAQGVDTLIIAGVSTSGCVRATAVDACQYGYIPIVCKEAVGDRHPQPHEAALFDVSHKYGEVMGENEVTAYLNSF